MQVFANNWNRAPRIVRREPTTFWTAVLNFICVLFSTYFLVFHIFIIKTRYTYKYIKIICQSSSMWARDTQYINQNNHRRTVFSLCLHLCVSFLYFVATAWRMLFVMCAECRNLRMWDMCTHIYKTYKTAHDLAEIRSSGCGRLLAVKIPFT